MNSEQIIARIHEIKQERATAVEERAAAFVDRDAAMQAKEQMRTKLDGVRTLVTNVGEGASLTKLLSFLKSIREIVEDSAS
ncbi:MAG: hypothetical protein RRZ24_11010 [Clostridia bacterium]